jgi:PAS domain S-box-containing protein
MSLDARTDGHPSSEDGTSLLEAVATLFRGDTADESLADGARLIARLADAPLVALFVLRGSGATESSWWESAPGTRSRFEPTFARAVVERAARTPGDQETGVVSLCGAPCLMVAHARDSSPEIVAVIAWPDREPASIQPVTAHAGRVLELLAAHMALQEWTGRFEAQRTRYERWFRTLDQQLRLLDRERQKFSAVVHQSDIHVFVADVSRVIRWTNKAMSHLAPDADALADWVGKECRELCGAMRGAASGPCSSCPVAVALESNEPAHYELHTVRHGASRTLYMTALPIRGPDGRPQESLVMLQDLTDLRVLRRSEARYRLLFERSVNSIVMVNPQRRTLVLANAMTARMLDYAPHELLGRALSELIVETEWPRFEALCSSIAAAGSLEGFESRLRARSGEERIAVVSPSRFDLHGEEVLLLEFLDVTERKRAEEALGEREQQLRQSQKMEAVGRLAGGIAHGFNNLLAVIMGRIGLIRDRLPVDHPVRRDAEQIHNACVQGSWLTRHLLTFSRKEMSTPRVLDLRDVVSEMDGMLRCVLGEKIELVTVPGGLAAPVLIDPAQIEQVLLNLVINARDAMPEGGVITVELTHVHLGHAASRESNGSSVGPHIRLAVRDDGVGMDEETRARVFEPFFTTKERGKGSGLGMSIVYGTVVQAGGHIEVSSELGMGTTVSIFLPSAEESPAPDSEAPITTLGAAGGETVLVVEDDDPVRAVTCEALELEGYTVLSACSGQDALDLLKSHTEPIALMVTDVVMPGISGGELARRLAVLRPDTKVIFVSGYVDDMIVREGVMAEGAPFLQKPFPLEALAAKAREVLDGAGASTPPRGGVPR